MTDTTGYVSVPKVANPDCILCHGTGYHAPAFAGPAVDEGEHKRRMASLPGRVRCGCSLPSSPPPPSPWKDIKDAPKDGTLLLLEVEYDPETEDHRHPLEDANVARTVGFNNFDNDGEDEWKFAGWCWDHDHFTEGNGRPVRYMLFPAGSVTPPTDGGKE